MLTPLFSLLHCNYTLISTKGSILISALFVQFKYIENPVTYLFAYTGKPWLVTDTVETVRKKFTLEGPPGNDDSGAMGSWYIFSSVGFFPNAGQDLYYLTSPHYEHTVIRLGNGKQIKIRAKSLSDENRYIQSVKINGQRHNSTMFHHALIADGAVFEFEMGPQPVDYTKTGRVDT